MMKTKFQLFCGWMAIALTACGGDELAQMDDTQHPDGTRVVSVKAYTPSEQPDSRLAFTDNGNGGLAVSWSEGDAFTAVVGGTNYDFTYNTDTKEFTATLPNDATLTEGMKAYYPAYTGERSTDLSAQTGKLDSKVTYMEGTYSVSKGAFWFVHSTAILKATFSGLPEGATVSSIKVGAAPYTINIPNSSELDLANGVYIYLPAVAKDGQVTFTVETSVGIYTATQTVKIAEGIELGKIYEAPIALAEADCELPTGEDFNAAIKSVEGFADATSIVFEAKSTETGGTRIGESAAYAKVEGATLKVYTAAKGFAFNADCSSMFDGMDNITSIDFGNCVNTAAVKKMNYMFKKCNSLTSLDLSGFNTAAVTSMNGMFQNCRSFTSLDLSGFNTTSVTNMSGMFGLCYSLQTLTFGDNFNTEKVTIMSTMFQSCHSLTSLDLSGFNTSSVTSMLGMFQNCKSLTELDLSSFTFTTVRSYNRMFFYVGKNSTSVKIYVSEAGKTFLEEKSSNLSLDTTKVTLEVKQ